MLSDIAWKTFEATGNIDAYVLYRDLKNKQAGTDCSEFSDELLTQEDGRRIKE